MAKTKAVVESQNETPTEVIDVEVQNEVTEVAPLSTQLDRNCHMDMEYLELWYQTKYLTKVVSKWAMKPGARIVHYVDGVIYKAANMTDEIAERLMKENPAYAEQFVQLN